MADITARVLTLEEAAAYCGMSRDAFRSQYPRGPLPLQGRGKRYDRVALDLWLDGLSGLTPDASFTAKSDGGGRDAYEERQRRKGARKAGGLGGA